MYDTAAIEQLLDDIENHDAHLAESEQMFLEQCMARFEAEGSLDSDLLAQLYEMLDRLDDRAGARADYDDYDFDEDEDDEIDDDAGDDDGDDDYSY